ncbi:RHS repeat protein [Flavobacterium sp. LaA7.5]|nr:RHS repeat protein [Flavobacterium salilacus subsp. altitudinum]
MKQLFLSSLLLFSIAVFGQEEPSLPEIIPPSPTVANLMHFEEVPVDTYTGQPDITIPLASKNLGSGLTLPLALRYSTLGLRVQERSGWVGKGWSLEAGGTVSRTVRGGVADEKQQSPGRNQIGIFFVEGFNNNNEVVNLFENFNSLQECEKKEYAWNVMGTKYEKWDSEPDLYQYSMLGMSGRFTVLKEGNQLVAKQLSLDQKVNIDLNYDSQTYVINRFTITDASGIKYIFGNGVTEINKSTPHSIVYPRQPRGGNTPGGSPDPIAPTQVNGEDFTESISAWHLVEITTSNDEELVSFSYTESIENYLTRVTRTENKLIESGIQYNGILSNTENLKYFKPERINSWASVEATTKKLSHINFRDGSSYEFRLSTQTNPENGGAYLSQIILKDKSGSIYRTITLDHTKKTTTKIEQQPNGGYSRVSDPSQRLWLNTVTIGTFPEAQEYILNYFDNDNFLSVDSENVDYWGYENGDFRNVLHNSHGYFYYDYNAVKRGVLTRITYPTGGTKGFFFEPHTFTYENGNERLDNYDENPLNENPYTHSHQFNVSICSGYNDVDDGGESVNITHNQNIMIDANINVNPEYVGALKLKITGELVEGGTYDYEYPLDDFTTSTTISVPAGYFYFKAVYYPAFIEGQPVSNCTIGERHVGGYININYRKKTEQYSSAYKNYLFGGGLRIKYIDFKEPMDIADPLKKRVMYDYNFFEDVEHGTPPFNFTYRYLGSNGVIDGSHNIFKNYTIRNNRFLFFNADNNTPGIFKPHTIKYEITINEPVVFLTKGSYVGYRSVKVSEREDMVLQDAEVLNYPKGYTQYDYTSAYENPISLGYFNYPFKELPEIDYKRGLLLKSTVFNNLGQKLQETNNSYDYDMIEGDTIFSFAVQEIESVFVTTENTYTGTCIWTPFYDTWENYAAGNAPITLQQYCALGYSSGPCFEDYFNCEGGNGGTSVGDCTALSGSAYFLDRNDITTGRSVLTSTQNTEYYYDNAVVTSTSSLTNYEYNLENYQIKSQTNVINEGGVANTYKTAYQYPVPVGGYDTTLFTALENDVIDDMEDKNIINAPIVVSSYKNDVPLQKVITKYDDFNGLILPYKAETIKSTGTTGDERIQYHDYNEIGNVTEVSQTLGTHTYYIWGYGGTLPVTKIDNFKTSDITPAIQTIIDNIHTASDDHVASDTSTEDDLKNALDSLRIQLPNHQITTLTHDAAKGVTLSVKDPRGIEVKYTYDAFGRLTKAVDHEGKLLTENEYHYRTE